MAATRTTGGTREIEGRDSVGLYLDEIARNPLLDAATEVELSKTIEAGLMAEALLKADPEAREGLLAPRLNALVRKETCAAVAREIRLGEALRLGRSEMMAGGRKRDALLGDAVEAVIAAVFLDGGFEAARAVVLRLWEARLRDVFEQAGFTQFRRAAETPMNLIIEARP